MMKDHQFAVGMFRKEMIGDAFQTGSKRDPQLIHALEVLEWFYRTSDIGRRHFGKPRGETVRTPQILDERPSSPGDLRRGMNSNRTIIHQLGGVNSQGQNT
jgi:hypothetical protein